MRISDWSSDVCSSDLFSAALSTAPASTAQTGPGSAAPPDFTSMTRQELFDWMNGKIKRGEMSLDDSSAFLGMTVKIPVGTGQGAPIALDDRSEEHTSELQSLMRISYAVFCLKTTTTIHAHYYTTQPE